MNKGYYLTQISIFLVIVLSIMGCSSVSFIKKNIDCVNKQEVKEKRSKPIDPHENRVYTCIEVEL